MYMNICNSLFFSSKLKSSKTVAKHDLQDFLLSPGHHSCIQNASSFIQENTLVGIYSDYTFRFQYEFYVLKFYSHLLLKTK